MTVPAVELRGVGKLYPGGSGGQAVVGMIDANLSIQTGEFFTLLGPSGCGKSTTLRLLAGFETPSQGEIRIDGVPMAGVPPFLRPVNMVFQDYALFPHMTVEENVAFGLKVKKVPGPECAKRVKEGLRLVQLEGLERRRPSQLSGGQKQRVALARALVNLPRVLLLDEPLGALDLKLRKVMQAELKHLQRQLGITFVYVTHDQEEALSMSDRIAVMNRGQVLQVDNPMDIYEQPLSRFVADFVGETNLMVGRVHEILPGCLKVDTEGRLLQIPYRANGIKVGQEVSVAIRPERLGICPHADDGILPAVVAEAIYLGTDTRYVVRLASGAMMSARVQNMGYVEPRGPAVGDRVFLSWTPADMRVLAD